MVDKVLDVKNLRKCFGKNEVLTKVNFFVKKGDVLGLIGISGSGKTTILNLLIGFWRPDSGEILYKGEEIHKHIKTIRQCFGFGTQLGSFYPQLSVRENLEFFGRLYNLDKATMVSQANSLLKLVELEKASNTLGGRLSAGMKRRLDIACALIHKPEVLILDEPTEDLDPMLRRGILGLIKKINKQQGTTVIITSHLLGEMEEICDRVAILHDGRIIKEGTPDELKGKYTKNEQIHLQSVPGNYKKIIDNLAKGKVINVKRDPNKVVIFTNKGSELLQDLINAVNNSDEKIMDIHITKPSLEEVFEILTSTGRKNV